MPRPNIEKEIKERIRHALSVKKKSITSIATDDSERIMFGRQINKDETALSALVLFKILYALHDVDANYILLGEGPMQKTANHPQIFNQQHYEMQNGQNNNGTINFGDSVIPYPVQALLEEKDKRIAELEEDKRRLHTVIDALTVKPRK